MVCSTPDCKQLSQQLASNSIAALPDSDFPSGLWILSTIAASGGEAYTIDLSLLPVGSLDHSALLQDSASGTGCRQPSALGNRT